MPRTEPILHQIESLGYSIAVETGVEPVTITAVDRLTGETFRVRDGTGDDYGAACELARLVLGERRERELGLDQ